MGNKCDAPASVKPEEAAAFAKEIGATLHMTSAKTGQGVENVFDDVSRRLLRKYNEMKRRSDASEGFILDNEPKNHDPINKKCC